MGCACSGLAPAVKQPKLTLTTSEEGPSLASPNARRASLASPNSRRLSNAFSPDQRPFSPNRNRRPSAASPVLSPLPTAFHGRRLSRKPFDIDGATEAFPRAQSPFARDENDGGAFIDDTNDGSSSPDQVLGNNRFVRRRSSAARPPNTVLDLQQARAAKNLEATLLSTQQNSPAGQDLLRSIQGSPVAGRTSRRPSAVHISDPGHEGVTEGGTIAAARTDAHNGFLNVAPRPFEDCPTNPLVPQDH